MPRLRLDSRTPCTFMHWTYSRFIEHPPLHDHAFHEVFWVTKGKGLEWIGGEQRTLEPGMLVLVRPEDTHGFSADRERPHLEFQNFAFASSLWTRLRQRHPLLSGTLWDIRAPAARVLRLERAELERVVQLAGELLGGARDALAAEAFLGMLVSHLARLEESRRRARMPSWLRELVARLERPDSRSLRTARLETLAGCSRAHLCREVRRHLATTPTGLLNAARMEHAARQLSSTPRAILDIMEDCGITNLGHFYVLFRRHFGTTPRRYRLNAACPPFSRRSAR